ncbi:hypothetical protein AMTR_s00131p00089030 [Amborella trichopoda]|uniref:WAT1-related protein n=1 Tax=Amborella trichopoda TaxID=13333 RepID=W1NR62_AMBTC|nr:hypothetical protein AMTR_s00131p00089030 [Amborella trichopoda]
MGVGGYGPVLSQLVFNSSAGVMYILIKAALEHGMNRYVFVTYRQAAATLAIVPLAFFLDRYQLHVFLSSPSPSPTFPVFTAPQDALSLNGCPQHALSHA